MRTTKCITENKTSVLRFIFAFFFYFFPFSISHSKVMNMEIFVKDFSGTTWSRILKFGTKLGNDNILCNKVSATYCLSVPLFVHFSFSLTNFSVTDFSASIWIRVFKFCIHDRMRTTKCITENKTRVLRFIFAFFFFFFLFQSLTPR